MADGTLTAPDSVVMRARATCAPRAGPALRSQFAVLLCMGAGLALLSSCASRTPAVRPAATSPSEHRALIEGLLPRAIPDRSGWARDIDAGFAALGMDPDQENVCAVVAVIAQESGFRVDPIVPGLGAIAWKEIDARAERAGVPPLLVHTALQLRSPDGRSYGERIDAARTEKDLSDIYEDFIGAVPMGQRLFAGRNPIRTRGPMQVNIAFAEQYAAQRPYPYPVTSSIADEVFTRRGSVYFGIAHLLGYAAPYDAYLYRFADYNAGQFSSRNAAFQAAVSKASGVALLADGALLPHEGDSKDPGSTELAVLTLAGRLNLSDSAIHGALAQGRSKDFEGTRLYQRVFALAERVQGGPMPRELIPKIKLQGPKISRTLTTDWYAHRVNGRFEQCLSR
jgi:Protein of unknown function (DUF1615)